MARQPEIQYIRPYADGSAARKLELLPQTPKPRTKLPKVRRVKPLVIHVDLMALCGIIVAAVMLVMLIGGCVELGKARQEKEQMASYVSSLRNENAELKHEYESGYDLDTVQKTADALGMIPVEEATQIIIQGIEPQVEIEFYEPTFWERAAAFFEGLFA